MWWQIVQYGVCRSFLITHKNERMTKIVTDLIKFLQVIAIMCIRTSLSLSPAAAGISERLYEVIARL